MEESKAKAPSGEDKLGKGNMFAYGLGGIPGTMEAQLKTSYHMGFLTEFAGINAAFIGTVNMVMTIWDAINDPLIGGIADRTNSKWGKYRPHMTWGILLWTVVTIMMFWVPNFSATGKNIYYVALLFLWAIASTAFVVPWQSLNSVLTQDSHERNVLLTYRMFIGTISITALSFVLIPIVNAVDGGRMGYFTVAVMVALISLVAGLICIRGAKKRDYRDSLPTPPKTEFKGLIKVFSKNKAVLTTAMMLGCINLNSALSSATSIYYHTYVTKNLYLISFGAMVSMVASIIIIPVMPALYKKFGKHKVYIIGCILTAITPVLLIIYRENLPVSLILASSFFFTLGVGLVNTTTVSFVPDCVDYTELHYGNPNAGLINALVSFVKKFMGSFSTMIVGFSLTFAGYVGGGTEASPALVNSIIAIKVISCLLLLVIGLIGLKMFPVTREYGIEMRQQLKAARVQRAAENKKYN